MIDSAEPSVFGSSTDESANPGSVTNWITSLQQGNQQAAMSLWDRYFERMVLLARKQLGYTCRAEHDEEDVALSAFKSVFAGITRGGPPINFDRDAFWRFVAKVTIRKAYNAIAHRQRQKRNPFHNRAGNRIQLDDREAIDCLLSLESRPEVAAELDDQFLNLLTALPKPELRQIVVLKLEGYTNREIANRLNRGLSSIERKLKTIREIWQRAYPDI